MGIEFGAEEGEAQGFLAGLAFDGLMDVVEEKQSEKPEDKPNKAFKSVESLEDIVGRIGNPGPLTKYEEIKAVDVTQSEEDNERVSIVLGIGFKDTDSPSSTASASIKDGVMTVGQLPLPSPEMALKDKSSLNNSNALLSALVETAEKGGCKEVIIHGSEVNSQTETMRESLNEQAGRHGWERSLGHFIKDFFSLEDTATKAAKKAIDKPAGREGFEFDKENSIWRLKLND